MDDKVGYYLIYRQHHLVDYYLIAVAGYQKPAHKVAHLLEVMARASNAKATGHESVGVKS